MESRGRIRLMRQSVTKGSRIWSGLRIGFCLMIRLWSSWLRRRSSSKTTPSTASTNPFTLSKSPTLKSPPTPSESTSHQSSPRVPVTFSATVNSPTLSKTTSNSYLSKMPLNSHVPWLAKAFSSMESSPSFRHSKKMSSCFLMSSDSKTLTFLKITLSSSSPSST